MPENLRGHWPTVWGSELRETAPFCSLKKLLPAGCACTSFWTAVPSGSSLWACQHTLNLMALKKKKTDKKKKKKKK